jgi:hypothetical protein
MVTLPEAKANSLTSVMRDQQDVCGRNNRLQTLLSHHITNKSADLKLNSDKSDASKEGTNNQSKTIVESAESYESETYEEAKQNSGVSPDLL